MKHINQALKALQAKMAAQGASYIASKDQMTMMDIIFFNELSQVLYMYDHYKTYSQTDYAVKLREDAGHDMVGKNIASVLTEADTKLVHKWFT